MARPTSIRLSDPASQQLAWLAKRYGNQTTALTVAIDRMYQEEVHMNGINERLLGLATVVHSEVCGCDNPRCATRQEIYEWLEDGDGGQGRAVADLVAEWRATLAPTDG